MPISWNGTGVGLCFGVYFEQDLHVSILSYLEILPIR